MSNNDSQSHRQRTSFGEKASDWISGFIGSWGFILSLSALIAVWILLNVLAVSSRWDAYPFILLNLVLSTLAAIQLPIILMSQNRMETKDRARARMDFETDKKAEKEINEIKTELKEIKTILKSRG
ncbi:MAG: DUF1003 domain-containing protein [bacterium]|nr:DUF1003 domain-containing protein [bacterium]